MKEPELLLWESYSTLGIIVDAIISTRYDAYKIINDISNNNNCCVCVQ